MRSSGLRFYQIAAVTSLFLASRSALPETPVIYCELATMNAKAAETQRLILETERAIFDGMIAEYTGKRMVDLKTSQRIYNQFRRFWRTHYTRFKRLAEFNNLLRQDLTLTDRFSKVISELNEKTKLHEIDIGTQTTDALNQVADLKKEVKQALEEVYGFRSANEVSMLGDSIDIYRVYRSYKELNRVRDAEQIDDFIAEQYLKYVESYDEALTKSSKPARTLAEISEDELELAHLAMRYKVAKAQQKDATAIGHGTNVSYEVERKHVEPAVQEQKDENGNITQAYVPERIWYSDETIRPSYADIIYQNFDEGDRYVDGLSQIKTATLEVSTREKKYRSIVRTLESALEEFNAAAGRETTSENFKKLLPQLEAAVAGAKNHRAELLAYSQWSDAKILAQWKNDDPEIFRLRNKSLLERGDASVKHLENVIEQIKRGSTRFEPVTELPDYTNELNQLRRYYTQNMIIKALIGSGAVGAGIYYRNDIGDFFSREADKLGLSDR